MDIDRFILDFALEEGKPLQSAPLSELLEEYPPEDLSSGVFHRVFRLRGTDWVLKEARWDLCIECAPGISLRMPPILGRALASVLPHVKTLLPHHEHLQERMKTYRTVEKIFGSAASPESSREFRERLEDTMATVESRHGFQIPTAVRAEILRDDVRFHPFLPREHLFYGSALSRENGGRATVFLLQEHLAGPTLRDRAANLTARERSELLLFATLVLCLHSEEGILPDTRPKFLFLEWMNWLTRTENIVVAPRGLTYVDTHLFWSTKRGIFGRGLLIPELTLGSCKRYCAAA